MYFGSLTPISTSATWEEAFEIYDEETNTLINISGNQIYFEITQHNEDGYPGTTGTATIVGLGTIILSLTAAETKQLYAGMYDAGIVIMREGVLIQQFIGSVQIFDGVVRL